jgi:hypothetical protein
MKKFKLNRNIYIFCGFCFLLSTFLQLRVYQLTDNKSVIVPILNGISCILMFSNAYIYHKKITKENKNLDKIL